MHAYKSFLFAAGCAFVVGCNQPGGSSEGESAPAMSEPTTMTEESASESTMASDAAPSASSSGSTQVDHSKDEKEFRLKASIAGLEELAADYREKGIDPSEVEAQIAEKKAELEAL